MSIPLTPEGEDSAAGATTDSTADSTTDSTTDSSTDSTADSTAADATTADGGDVLDEILANHASGGWSDPAADAPGGGAVGNEEPDESVAEQPQQPQQPHELDADAMGRPLSGSMNYDDQGMENAGANLGD